MSILTLFKGLKHPAPAPWGPVRKGGAMNLLEAVWVRRSQRTYLPRPLEEVQREQLGKALAECSRRSGLHLRLVCPQVSPFAGQGRLKGAREYLLLAGPAEDPDLEEICGDNPDLGTPEEYLSLWQVDWNRAESLVAEGRAFEAFDLDSFVDYFLLYNIVGNREIGWPKSLYVHKREIGEGCRYEFGPAWDFDICMNTKQVFDDVVVIKAPDLPMWLNPMFEVLVEYDEFRKAYRGEPLLGLRADGRGMPPGP